MTQLKLLLLLMLVVAAKKQYQDLAAKQIIKFAERVGRPIGILNTGSGAPVEYLDANVSLNRQIISNEYLIETLTHLNRQRIPERVVHARGAGAFGYFEVTHPLNDICKAKFLNKVGKNTPIAVRFSLIIPRVGSSDTTRDGRGFAVKFYTEDGNFDIVGLNIPVFPHKDPLFFTTLVNAQGKNPATHLNDNNMLWDYVSLRPEAIHFVMYKFGDSGIPDGYRYMPGFSIHTYQVVNERGRISFVRFHFISNQGFKFLKSDEAARIGGQDPDYAIRDLYNAIARGDYPSWQVSVQVLSIEDVKRASFDVFDVTRALPFDKYPLRPLGRFVLNRNPINYFAEVEQIAMSPSHLVPGIPGAPDKLFEARRLGYRDAQYYRLGANFQRIPVNRPATKPRTYNVDGVAPVKISDAPVYYPNTYNGPVPYLDEIRTPMYKIVQDTSLNFDQASQLYISLAKDARKRLIDNLVDSIGKAERKLQDRIVNWFRQINPDFGNRVEYGLVANRTSTPGKRWGSPKVAVGG